MHTWIENYGEHNQSWIDLGVEVMLKNEGGLAKYWILRLLHSAVDSTNTKCSYFSNVQQQLLAQKYYDATLTDGCAPCKRAGVKLNRWCPCQPSLFCSTVSWKMSSFENKLEYNQATTATAASAAKVSQTLQTNLTLFVCTVIHHAKCHKFQIYKT